MRLYADLDRQILTRIMGVPDPITEVEVKRSPFAQIEIQFVRAGTVTELPVSASGVWEVKMPGKYDDAPVTAALAWVKTGTGETTVYTFTLSLITAAIDAALGVDSAAPAAFTVTTATDLITSSAHGRAAGSRVRFRTTGTLPAGLAIDTDYFVSATGLTANDYKVSLSNGGPIVDITTTGTGTQTWVPSVPDIAQFKFMAAMQWIADGNENETQTIDFTVLNDVVRDGDVPPSTPPLAYAVFWTEVTTMAEFKAVPTANLQPGYIVEILIEVGGQKSWLTYRKTPGPATEAEPEHVEPDDYDGVANDYHWEGASGPSGIAGRDAGIAFKWNTSTATTDPTTGEVKVNNATLASATELYISETDDDGNALAPLLATWDDGTSTIRGRLIIQDPANPANFVGLDITGALTDNGTWDTFTVVHVYSGGTLTNNMPVRAFFFPKGDKGDIGVTGSPGGIPYTWSTDITSTDPTSGKVKVNNATLSAATALYISETDAAAHALATYLATLDDSTSTIKGRIFLTDPANPANIAIFDITGTITDNGAWDTFTIAYVASSGAFINGLALRLIFVPKGDKGDPGTPGGTGAQGRESGALYYIFNSGTGASNPGTGKVAWNNSNPALATSLFINETDNDGNAMSALLATWDNGTSTIKGRLFIHSASVPTTFAIFDITGTLTDNGLWDTFTIAYVTHNGSFTNLATYTLHFAPAGDAGSPGAPGVDGADGGTTYDAAVAIPSGATPTVDLSTTAMSQQRLLAANTTVNFSSPVNGKVSLLHFKQAAANSWTVDLPDVDVWVGTGGVQPTMSPGFNVVDTYTVWYDGTFLYASWAPGE